MRARAEAVQATRDRIARAAMARFLAQRYDDVTIAAVAAARRRGVIRDGDEVVALVTGNGLKTPDARRFGAVEPASARPGEPGLAPVIRPSLAAFEDWLEGRA